MPARDDATRIAIFEALIAAGWPLKAKFAMKIDMVKPMPPSIPAPTIWREQPDRHAGGAQHALRDADKG